ncbi:conserved hypothetical protein [Frankia canadensis]|uniref:Uncharacterized protein n=1 Tax=Frankia canadensis TaxID=1836972 RepID=A0A2I2L2Q9_9ACTN|nr:hypothetical protein [Frankia canadensis]SNQ52147.1 conserved hypothetical protein [Frankia canadensis]SOU59437.1 conserved hypothetical protein [Frankia canadensis]
MTSHTKASDSRPSETRERRYGHGRLRLVVAAGAALGVLTWREYPAAVRYARIRRM